MFSPARVLSRKKVALYGTLAGVAILTGGLAATAPAKATSINQFNTGGGRCGNYNSKYAFCLWYSPNMDGGVWGASGSVKTISATFANGGDGTSGVGDSVRNDAASAANNINAGVTYTCTPGVNGVFIWVYPSYTGSYDSLQEWYGGNLTSDLRNNEASVDC